MARWLPTAASVDDFEPWLPASGFLGVSLLELEPEGEDDPDADDLVLLSSSVKLSSSGAVITNSSGSFLLGRPGVHGTGWCLGPRPSLFLPTGGGSISDLSPPPSVVVGDKSEMD